MRDEVILPNRSDGGFDIIFCLNPIKQALIIQKLQAAIDG
jgi:hypothetical protein